MEAVRSPRRSPKGSPRQSPRVIDLATPLKPATRRPAGVPPLSALPPPLPGRGSPNRGAVRRNDSDAAKASDPDGNRNAGNESGSDDNDVFDSPRLPPDWMPLEYELLEYADSLPTGFAEVVGRELEAQHRRVSQVRWCNTMLLNVLRSEDEAKMRPAAGSPSSQASVCSSTPRKGKRLPPDDEQNGAPAVQQTQPEAKTYLAGASKVSAAAHGAFGVPDWATPKHGRRPQPEKQVAHGVMPRAATPSRAGRPEPEPEAACAAAASPAANRDEHMGHSAERDAAKLFCPEASPRHSQEEVQRRLEFSATSKRLESQVLEVRRKTEKELKELVARLHSVEEQGRKLMKESTSADSQGKQMLFEAEGRLNRLRNRLQQLEAQRSNVERKRQLREAEDRHVSHNLALLQAEVSHFRSRVKEFDEIERREEEMSRALRSLKSELRSATTREKAAAAMTAIESAWQTQVSPASPRLGGRSVAPNRVPTPLRSRPR
eukprot:TRINITY_DN46358_c0_g1_i1.p1 TRINITY_DN46358_c0_g1~~TRINITY_DN46358_c0_g1_i1.p1  ORF type:complete len:504 (-),score=87.48 TRINITY_DN46358_c0_g1_i1:114-1583(-)